MQHLSWRRYDEKYGLSELLTGAARACVTAHATAPGSFLAAYFMKMTRGDRVASLRCSAEWAPQGAGMRVQLRLFTHAEGVVGAVPLLVPTTVSATSSGTVGDGNNNNNNTISSSSGNASPHTNGNNGGSGGSGEASAGGGGGVGHAEMTAPRAMRALSYAEVKQVEAALRRTVLPALMNIAVDEQTAWDTTLETAASLLPQPQQQLQPPAEKEIGMVNGRESSGDRKGDREDDFAVDGAGVRLMPSALCLAFSLAATTAAAAARSLALYEYIRQLYTAERGAGRRLTTCVGTSLMSSGDEALLQDGHCYIMPQLLIPFLGRDTTVAPGVGTVALHTLYVLPGPALPAAREASEEGTGEEEQGARSEADALGLMSASVMDKLLLASRRLRQRGGAGETGLRADGACIFEAADNLSDAVEMAMSVLNEAGLRPRVDYMLGLRICAPCSHVDLAGTINSMASSATVKAKRPVTSSNARTNQTTTTPTTAAASAAAMSETRYGLFPGEAEVSAAQLAEYVRQQLSEDNVVSFVEDSHDGQDVTGAYRMQSALRDAAVTLSTRAPYEDAETAAERVHHGISHGLSANLALDPIALRTLSRLLATASLVHAHGRSVSLTTAQLDETAMPLAVDLALGVGARYLEVGNLHQRSGCAALSRWMERQEQLSATRALRARPSIADYTLHDLPSVPDEPVAELKRKNDKKRKKPTKH